MEPGDWRVGKRRINIDAERSGERDGGGRRGAGPGEDSFAEGRSV